jgi:hypothetical protein
MTIKIGIDFDNTIVNYDILFHQEGLKQNILNGNSHHNSKNRLKKILISKNKEAEWTAIQGKVYGKRMLKALPYKGVIQFIQKISKEKKFKIFIVSHKTLHPIVGEKINLHKLSRKWIEKNKIFISSNNNFKNQIFFLKTKEKKINKIVNLKCDYFIDDLKEILDLLPKTIKKIHFTPYVKNKRYMYNSWNDIQKVFEKDI